MIENLINYYYIKKAKRKLNKFSGLKIAITGSYGKTSTKYFLGESLKDYYVSTYTKNSYNTPLGISLQVNSENIDLFDIFTFEMGATKKNDISYLMNYIKPDITIVTSIGYMHLDTFKSIKNIISEKTKAIDMNKDGICIVNVENEFIRNHKTSSIVIGYGFNYGDFQAKNVVVDKNISFDVYKYNNYFDHYKLNLNGYHNVLNILAVIVLLDYLKISKKNINKSISKLKNKDNRLNIINFNKSIILDDSFNSNIEGATSALNILKSYSLLKILITPGFVELKDIEDELYKNYVKVIKDSCDLVFLVGYKNTIKLYDLLIKENCIVYVFSSFNKAYQVFLQITKEERCALLIENDLPDIYMEGFLID